MGKAQRVRERSAREKIAAQQAAARRAEARRRLLIIGGSVVAVIAIVVAFVVVKLGSGSSTPSASGSSGKPLPASVVSDLAGVPASTFNKVGRGDVTSLIPISGAPPLTANGKPEMLYMGGEYCPFCAAERWAMAVALSRFGTFSGLHGIHSSSTDVYPSTPTLSFYKSSYASSYLTFTPVEWYSLTPQSSSPTGYAPLQTPTSSQAAIFSKYDSPPYVSSSNKGAFPFVDIGNRYVISGAQYLPSVLHGLTWAQVAAGLKDPASPVARNIDAAANTITAAICKVTGSRPSNICSSSAVAAGNGAL